MPNNCCGTLKITASDELLKKILDTVHGTGDDEDNPFDFNKIIPMPDYIFRGDIDSEVRKLYGKNNWYDWSIENWGTKWNSCDTERYGNCFSFWTAWSPCRPVIKALAEMFPNATFDYWYEETGNAFCGHEIYEHGKAKYIMEADYEEFWIVDDDYDGPQFEDYYAGNEKVTITILGITNGVRQGRIEKREDMDEYVKVISGEFVERTDDSDFDILPYMPPYMPNHNA